MLYVWICVCWRLCMFDCITLSVPLGVCIVCVLCGCVCSVVVVCVHEEEAWPSKRSYNLEFAPKRNKKSLARISFTTRPAASPSRQTDPGQPAFCRQEGLVQPDGPSPQKDLLLPLGGAPGLGPVQPPAVQVGLVANQIEHTGFAVKKFFPGRSCSKINVLIFLGQAT